MSETEGTTPQVNATENAADPPVLGANDFLDWLGSEPINPQDGGDPAQLWQDALDGGSSCCSPR